MMKNGANIDFDALSDGDLSVVLTMASAQAVKRLIQQTPLHMPFMATAIENWGRPVAPASAPMQAWSSQRALETVKTPPAVVVPPTTVPVQATKSSEEQEHDDDSDQVDDYPWVKACGSAKRCNCRYYLLHSDENDEKPELDLKTLFINRGIVTKLSSFFLLTR